MPGLAIKSGSSVHQLYGRETEQYVWKPRHTKGDPTAAYLPPVPCAMTAVSGVHIVLGRIYKVVPKSSVSASVPNGAYMVAAQNNRGEMVLCFQGENGRPFGCFHLKNFSKVEVVL